MIIIFLLCVVALTRQPEGTSLHASLQCVAALTTQPEGTSLHAGLQCDAAYIMMWTDTVSNTDNNQRAVSNAGNNISVYNTISSPRSLSIVMSSIQLSLQWVFGSLHAAFNANNISLQSRFNGVSTHLIFTPSRSTEDTQYSTINGRFQYSTQSLGRQSTAIFNRLHAIYQSTGRTIAFLLHAASAGYTGLIKT